MDSFDKFMGTVAPAGKGFTDLVTNYEAARRRKLLDEARAMLAEQMGAMPLPKDNMTEGESMAYAHQFLSPLQEHGVRFGDKSPLDMYSPQIDAGQELLKKHQDLKRQREQNKFTTGRDATLHNQGMEETRYKEQNANTRHSNTLDTQRSVAGINASGRQDALDARIERQKMKDNVAMHDDIDAIAKEVRGVVKDIEPAIKAYNNNATAAFYRGDTAAADQFMTMLTQKNLDSRGAVTKDDRASMADYDSWQSKLGLLWNNVKGNKALFTGDVKREIEDLSFKMLEKQLEFASNIADQLQGDYDRKMQLYGVPPTERNYEHIFGPGNLNHPRMMLNDLRKDRGFSLRMRNWDNNIDTNPQMKPLRDLRDSKNPEDRKKFEQLRKQQEERARGGSKTEGASNSRDSSSGVQKMSATASRADLQPQIQTLPDIRRTNPMADGVDLQPPIQTLPDIRRTNPMADGADQRLKALNPTQKKAASDILAEWDKKVNIGDNVAFQMLRKMRESSKEQFEAVRRNYLEGIIRFMNDGGDPNQKAQKLEGIK